MLQDDDEMKYKDWDGAYSLVSKWQKGKVNLWTDLSFADRENGDVVGLQIMPFYDITDQTQIIFCYTSLDSSDKDQLKKADGNTNWTEQREVNCRNTTSG